MNVLLQFFIEKKKKEQERFLFWSCVLDSSLISPDFSLDYLNTTLHIENFTDFDLKIEYRTFTQEIIDLEYKEYNKNRPEVFLITDATTEHGSPYSHASSIMKTYYQIPMEFIPKLAKFVDLPTDYLLTKFQLQIISTIKKELGIHIIKNESIPGCLSIYTRMPSFSVDGCYNAFNNKPRYITITSDEATICKNAIVEIDIRDKEKILFKKVFKYTSDFYFNFPSLTELEHFFEFRILIYYSEKLKEPFSKIYEEHFHLIRSFHISGSVGGGHHKIINNRFLQKSTDKISIMDHQPFSSTLGKKDWIDWEEEYKLTLFVQETKYLESMFFDKTTGREKFLNWARQVISRGRKITIVDPYFDERGLQDFCACIDTYVKICILMKDPKEFNADVNLLLKKIFISLPGAEIYFINDIHDRYLIIKENEEDTIVYSLSNSWNGTVNNFSLFVQEVPLSSALQIEEEIEYHIKNGKFQINNNTINNEKKEVKEDKTIFTESYINNCFEQLNAVISNTDIDSFINICSELFRTQYYGETEKTKIVSILNRKIVLFEEKKILAIISKIIIDLLNKQKEEFMRKNHYIDNKPFTYYDTPEKCIERIGLDNYFATTYFDLDLNYPLYELLKTIFYIYPALVINELTENEKKLCIIYIGDKKKKEQYHISELIINSFLICKYPAIIPIEKDIEEFIDKVKSFVYCRIFFAWAIIYYDRKEKLPFGDLLKLLNFLTLTSHELLLLLSDMYCKFSSRKQNQWNTNNNLDYLLNEITNFVLQNYNNKDIIKYAYKAYIETYELKINELEQFIKQLENLNYNNEIHEIEKLLLLCSSQTNQKLYAKIQEILKPQDYIIKDIIKPLKTKEPKDIDTIKYHNILPHLGNMFASFLKNKNKKDKFSKLHTSLNIYKTLIFKSHKFPENIGIFYYEAAFLLSTILSLRKSGIRIKKSVLDLLDWYLPACLNAYSDDYFGLSIQVIDLITTLQTDNKNRVLYNSVNSLRDKMLISSNIKHQTNEYINLYKKTLKNYSVSDDKKSIIVFLNITINLCFRCADSINYIKREELLNILEQHKNIAHNTINESVYKLINTGIDYAKSPSKETENIFIKTMNTVYIPYSARLLFEAIDE
jgi:hypothetical protein